MKAQLEKLHAEVNEAIDSAETLCKAHGITRLATYDTEPLAIEVKVISSFGRRYLELMTKVDQLMPMLETLSIDDVIEVAQLDLQIDLAKKSVRQDASILAGGAERIGIALGRVVQRRDRHVESERTCTTGSHLTACTYGYYFSCDHAGFAVVTTTTAARANPRMRTPRVVWDTGRFVRDEWTT